MLITGTFLSYCAKRCSVINANIDAGKWEATAGKASRICIDLFVVEELK